MSISIQTTENQTTKRQANPWMIWAAASSFAFFQFLLQLSSGVMVDDWMRDFALNATQAGFLSSSFYYVYVSLQTPAGAIVDRYGARTLLSLGAATCAIACLLFAKTDNYAIALLARLLLGAGSAFAFVGDLHVIRHVFPKHHYGFMVGLTESQCMLGSLLGIMFIAHSIEQHGWRLSLSIASLCFIAISIWCAGALPKQETQPDTTSLETLSFFECIRQVLKDPLLWLNGLYCGLIFMPVSVFAALWAIPFLITDVHASLSNASISCGFIFLGATIGSPISGYAYEKFKDPRWLLSGGAGLSCLFTSIIIYMPITSLTTYSILMFALGLCCCSYVLSFPIANELSSKALSNTAAGFTNTLCMITAPIVQPIIGWLLDTHTQLNQAHYSLSDYHMALSILPLSMAVCIVIPFAIFKGVK